MLLITISTIMIFVWIFIALIALIIEFNTADLSSIWATFGGVVTMIVAIFCKIIWVQIVVFIVVTLLGLIIIKRFVKRYVKRNEIQTNSDALVGKTAIVTKKIEKDLVGAAKVEGKEWSAISKNNEEIEENTKVEILAIEGVKLIVKIKE